MAEHLTLADVAAETGEAIERLREWQSAGLIGREDDGACAVEDVQRAWIIRYLLRRGATLDALARADVNEDFLERYREEIFRTARIPTHSLPEACRAVGIDDGALVDALERSQLFPPGMLLDDDDVQALGAIKIAIDAGFPADAMMQLMRVYADAMCRIAEAETRLFHFYVHQPLRARSLSGRELVDATTASRARVTPLAEPAILYFHRRGWRQAVLDDAVLHLQDDAAPGAELPGQLRAAVAFVDLSSFTPLADVMGDDAAAAVLDRFSCLVRDAASRWDGRVVKQIGDAFMLVFSEARSAVACALDIDRRTVAEPHFPAVRSGIHVGPVLYREGDYVGATVNLAARLAAAAERHQTAVTEPVRAAAGDLPGVTFQPLGRWKLKGLSEEIEVFAATSADAAAPAARLVDPVCGMELDAAAVSVRLTLDGREQAFCSEACLQRFVLAPDLYRDAARRT